MRLWDGIRGNGLAVNDKHLILLSTLCWSIVALADHPQVHVSEPPNFPVPFQARYSR